MKVLNMVKEIARPHIMYMQGAGPAQINKE